MQPKSTPAQIRHRFDNDVERFSDLETGQTATIDAALVLDLMVRTARAVAPHARRSLDVGSGAGNYTLKLLEQLPDLDVDLLDLSAPMLERASQRLAGATGGRVTTMQADIREAELGSGTYDVIMAGASLHHLRETSEWEQVFSKLYTALAPGGCLLISDLVQHDNAAVQELMWLRYGEYLEDLRDAKYREHVFAYIEKEDSPRPLMYQLDLLRRSGFDQVDVLHKNGPFAAFCGVKGTAYGEIRLRNEPVTGRLC